MKTLNKLRKFRTAVFKILELIGIAAFIIFTINAINKDSIKE